ncbi:hypothetical protein ABVK33_10070 [Mycobacterium kansasii]
MSGEAISDAVGVSNATVSRDLSTLTDVRVDEDRKVLGQDGRERSYPQPKPSATTPEDDSRFAPAFFECGGIRGRLAGDDLLG